MKNILIILILAAILTFGCLGGSNPTNNGNTGNQNNVTPYPNGSYPDGSNNSPPVNNQSTGPIINSTNDTTSQNTSYNGTTFPGNYTNMSLNNTENGSNMNNGTYNGTYNGGNSTSTLSCGKVCHILSTTQNNLCVSQSDPQQICTMQYSAYDQCKAYYDCTINANSCMPQKTDKFDLCMNCVSQCDINSSACVQSCYNQINGGNGTTNNTSGNMNNNNSTFSNNGTLNSTSGGISQSILSSHSFRNDCWVVNEGQVYQITNWMSEHASLADNMYQMCGTTQSFNSTFEAYPEIDRNELFSSDNFKGSYQG